MSSIEKRTPGEVRFRPDLTKEFIFLKLSEEEIFEAYGVPVVDYQFCNPKRHDTRPTCSFYRRRSDNRLILRDYTGWFWGDCFDFVMKISRLNYAEALRDIANRFGLFKGDVAIIRTPLPPRVNISKPECKIRVKRLFWDSDHLRYWEAFHISQKTLEKYNVAPLDMAWLNDQQIFSYDVKGEIAFCYYFGGYDYKVYFPTRDRKSMRFLHNNTNILQGYEQLPEKGNVCIITKALKDVMTLYEYGIPAVAPMAENMFISEVVQEELSSRFDNLFCLYDLDITGITTMKVARSRGITPIWFPRGHPKDFSDFVKKFGTEDTHALIQMACDYFNVQL